MSRFELLPSIEQSFKQFKRFKFALESRLFRNDCSSSSFILDYFSRIASVCQYIRASEAALLYLALDLLTDGRANKMTSNTSISSHVSH